MTSANARGPAQVDRLPRSWSDHEAGVRSKVATALCFLVVVISGNPVAGVPLGPQGTYIAAFAILAVYAHSKELLLWQRDLAIIALFTVIVLYHVAAFNVEVVPANLGFLARLGIAFLAMKAIPHFFDRYVRIMIALCAISLLFHGGAQIDGELVSRLSFMTVPMKDFDFIHVGLHNFNTPEERHRNSGMFWEPGAFSGYIILALLLVIVSTRDPLREKWKLGVLLLALLTTQSTTGYLALILIAGLLIARILKGKYRLALLFFFPALGLILVAVGYALFMETSFMWDKLVWQVDEAVRQRQGSEINRFGNLLYDLQFIEARPLFGWSFFPGTRMELDPFVMDLIAGQGNGLSGFAVRMGLFGLAVYLLFIYLAIYRIRMSLKEGLAGALIISALLVGEQFLNYPLFFAPLFLSSKSGFISRGKRRGQVNTYIDGGEIDRGIQACAE